jgi:hypothetical protein
VTDPDRRGITDQRHASDAELHYQMGSSRPRTNAQWLEYFSEHYGSKYEVAAPSAPGGQWRATAQFGQRDQLFKWSPTELLDDLIDHRHGNHMDT